MEGGVDQGSVCCWASGGFVGLRYEGSMHDKEVYTMLRSALIHETYYYSPRRREVSKNEKRGHDIPTFGSSRPPTEANKSRSTFC